MGRRSTYDKAIADKICAKLSVGIPLAEICREAGMPAVRTVSDWKAANEEFAAMFARARDDGYDYIAAECMRIADTPLEGVTTEESESGVKIKREDMLGHRKLQIETRLKLLAKWDPRRYGDKLSQEISGANGSPFVVQVVKFSNDDNPNS